MRKEYILKARFYPAIIALLPLIVFYLFMTDTYANGIIKFLSFSIFGVGIGFVLYDQLVDLIRAISKKFEFSDENMPTTKYLLNLVKADKNNILLKNIKEKEGLELSENTNIESILMVSNKIISKLRDNELVFQHNIEYGKARNMIGASLLGLFFTVILLIVTYVLTTVFNVNLIASSLISIMYIFLGILLIVYVISFLYYKTEFKKRGEDYAKILFKEYLGDNK